MAFLERSLKEREATVEIVRQKVTKCQRNKATAELAQADNKSSVLQLHSSFQLHPLVVCKRANGAHLRQFLASRCTTAKIEAKKRENPSIHL